MVYNITQTDYPQSWPNAVQEVQARLGSSNERELICGLRALKNILRAFEFEIDEDRQPME